MELISELADILMEEDHVERLSNSATRQEFIRLLQEMRED
ncbi:MAG: hypothetical protein ACLUQK_16790 [Clostridium sp.]